MRLFVHILTGIALGLAAVTIGYYLIGIATGAFTGENGMAILVFQLFGAIFCIAALLFGGIGRFLTKRASLPNSVISKTGIFTGAAGLVILIGSLIFG